jgi:hypothetical protein
VSEYSVTFYIFLFVIKLSIFRHGSVHFQFDYELCEVAFFMQHG